MPSKARFRKGDRVFTGHIDYPGPLRVLLVEVNHFFCSGWAVTFKCGDGVQGKLDQCWLRHAPKKKEARRGK